MSDDSEEEWDAVESFDDQNYRENSSNGDQDYDQFYVEVGDECYDYDEQNQDAFIV